MTELAQATLIHSAAQRHHLHASSHPPQLRRAVSNDIGSRTRIWQYCVILHGALPYRPNEVMLWTALVARHFLATIDGYSFKALGFVQKSKIILAHFDAVFCPVLP